ncbi:c-5 sterol desaturase [Terramyces sp. JEL0728]|nr:c-5 sterol desaturase [Terramyces sp. JEL0728]
MGNISVTFLYFVFSTISYYTVFDRSILKHPKYLKNQILKEIKLSVYSFPITSLVTVPWFYFEIKGYSKLYHDVDDYGYPYLVLSLIWFILFTDFGVYWIHSIHDGVYVSNDGIINSAAHHTVHHLEFNYNYGQYFTLWDRIGGSYRFPQYEYDNNMFFEKMKRGGKTKYIGKEE